MQIISKDKLVLAIEEKIKSIDEAYGKLSLMNRSTTNVYIQHARGKKEAYMECLVLAKELSFGEIGE